MSDTEQTPEAEAEAPPKKRSKLPLIIGLVLMLVLGGGGFFAVYSGMILGQEHKAAEDTPVEDLPAVGFVPVEPLTVTLGQGAKPRYLRFASQIEVREPHLADVTHILPRIQDVMNGYLRALEPEVLEDPTALVRIKAQLLRRIQLVSGEGRVRDLLITEFVVN